jgi:hypothetical protein
MKSTHIAIMMVLVAASLAGCATVDPGEMPMGERVFRYGPMAAFGAGEGQPPGGTTTSRTTKHMMCTSYNNGGTVMTYCY